MLHKLEGIVIRTNDYGETNKVITLFTRESGKIGAMARGAKKPKSRLSAVTQLFTHGQFLVQQGSGLGTVQQGEILSSYRSLREDIVKTAHAAYIVELTDKLTEDKQSNPYLYELLNQTLNYMNEGIDIDVLTFLYEMKMLIVGGIQPQVNGCVSCGAVEGSFRFSIREGGFLCSHCMHRDPTAIPMSTATARLLKLFYHFDLNRLGKISVKAETKQELKLILTEYYREYSGLYLKSKRFLEQLDSFKLE